MAHVAVVSRGERIGPCVWMGFAELSGGASVTHVSAGDYVTLRVLNVGGFDEAVTIREDARLFCLQADADVPSVAAALIGGCALLAFARGVKRPALLGDI